MARLKLKQGIHYRDVGEVIADMATHAKEGNMSAVGTDADRLKGLIDQSGETILDIVPNQVRTGNIPDTKVDSVYLNVHFDHTERRDGYRVRIVNVVVPDFDGKLSQALRKGGFDAQIAEGRGEDFRKSIVDLDAIAMEAFGFITICGCGN